MLEFKKTVPLLLFPVIAACGGSSGGSGEGQSLEFGANPELSASNVETQITLDWNDEGANYNLYYAKESIEMVDNYGIYDSARLIQNVSPPVQVSVDSLKPVYYFRLTKINGGNETQPSSEIVVTPRYTVSGDGATIIDEVNQLEWDRCVAGQTWSTEVQNCEGEPRRINYLGGEGALGYATDVDARIPTIPELYTLLRTGNEFYYDLDNPDIEYTLEEAQELGGPRTISELFVDPRTGVRYWASSTCSEFGRDGDVTNFSWPGENSIGLSGLRCGSFNFDLYLRVVRRL